MSTHIVSAVWKLDLPTPAAKLVALFLADCADHDGGNAYPSVETIAAGCGIDRRTVQRALAQLAGIGVLEVEVEATPHRPRTYRVNVGRQNVAPTEEEGRQNVAPIDPEGRHSVPGGATFDPERGGRMSPDPIRDPIRDPADQTRARARLFEIAEQMRGTLVQGGPVERQIEAWLDRGVTVEDAEAAFDATRAAAPERPWHYCAAVLGERLAKRDLAASTPARPKVVALRAGEFTLPDDERGPA